MFSDSHWYLIDHPPRLKTAIYLVDFENLWCTFLWEYNNWWTCVLISAIWPPMKDHTNLNLSCIWAELAEIKTSALTICWHHVEHDEQTRLLSPLKQDKSNRPQWGQGQLLMRNFVSPASDTTRGGNEEKVRAEEKCTFCFKWFPRLKWPPSLPTSNSPTSAGGTLFMPGAMVLGQSLG